MGSIPTLAVYRRTMTSVKKIHPIRVVIRHHEDYYQVVLDVRENDKVVEHVDRNEFKKFIDALLTAENLSSGHRVPIECLI